MDFRRICLPTGDRLAPSFDGAAAYLLMLVIPSAETFVFLKSAGSLASLRPAEGDHQHIWRDPLKWLLSSGEASATPRSSPLFPPHGGLPRFAAGLLTL